MFYKLTLACAIMLACVGAMAAEKEECGPAVDEADQLAAGIDKNCDYTKTGLNGVLHKALSNKKAEKDATEDKPSEPVSQAGLSEKAEFKTPQQLQQVKFALLEAAALKCPAGFSVESERYLPVPGKAMKLELTYHCL